MENVTLRLQVFLENTQNQAICHAMLVSADTIAGHVRMFLFSNI